MSASRLDAVTRRYAGALFGLAARKGALEAVKRDVARLAAELEVRSVATYLFDTRVPLEERRRKFDPLLAPMHELVRNFVSILFDKRREGVLRGLAAAFHERGLAEARAAEGVVFSPAPLGADEIQKLAGVFSRVLAKSVRLENRIDPELIAGVRVVADNKMIDFSARGRLDGLRRKLLAAALPGASRA